MSMTAPIAGPETVPAEAPEPAGGRGTLVPEEPHTAFRLRGHSPNPLVDAASPLLGLVIRVRELEVLDDVAALYRQVVEDIGAIELELTEQGLDRPTLLAYRYVLCTFVDEAVMGTEWGQQSDWSRHSLLARFHNETWGGEKVFAILARLQQEPQRYEPLLTFIYICFSLGFQGRYRIRPDRREEYERIVRSLGEQLSSLQPSGDENLTEPERHIAPAGWRSGEGVPAWLIPALSVLVAVGLYLAISWSLDQQAAEVHAFLHQVFADMGDAS
ncbi:type IVB secretion system protein IcmH/DotU [Alkalilimnicola ehrlichii MLHE-1]|uniref:Type IV / VI secretion system DotU domain-containing protein n=1 Tax=Alkalilimnicola ehrlichii (strain ATCC BAA-1101 / DSM 17681 / MLHE-1) TaxID=187272 RepID=Q0ACM7_ALKEH|nr:type IVB secretion system protein IcmH/DotU [Alkalilimnicola ehrlichii]ABI55410.1 conserved hypothetical protein [Alkalilimnicola ehrlichii MLHE-1]